MLKARAIGLATATALVCALASAPAGATVTANTVTWDSVNGYLIYQSADGQASTIDVSSVGDVLTLTDSAATTIDVAGAALVCPVPIANTVTCTAAPGTLVKVYAGDLADTVTYRGGLDVKLLGGAGDDVLTGGDADDRLLGDEGDDRLLGGAGADRFEGGSGRDLVDYSDRIAPITATPETGDDDGAAGEGDEVRWDVESAIGGAGGDTLAAGKEGGVLTGGAGEDVLTGGPGVDAFDAGAAHDHVYAADELAEQVACGSEDDEVEADMLDKVAADCEKVARLVRPAPEPTPVPTTEARAEPTPAPSAPNAEPAAGEVMPEAGHSLVVEPKVAGTVRVKAPGEDGYVSLAERKEIPLGSTVDVRKGAVTLTADAGGGDVQSARFSGAVFTVTQEVGPRPVTELKLRGGSFARCPRARALSSALAHAAKAAKDRKRVVRSLWGSGHGRFRTVGRHSAASVRGTIWQTVDRCDGTLTRVRRGVVRVADFTRNRFVNVRAGHQYLAPRRAR